MVEIIKQGQVDITGTILYTGTSSTLSTTKISQLKFYNPLPYVLTLQRYDAASASTETLYEFTLDAGDSVNDTALYALNVGDQLIVYSSIPGTSFYIYGLDYAGS